MEGLIPLTDPHYPKTSSSGGRLPYPLKKMLRIHLMQYWNDFIDLAMENTAICWARRDQRSTL